MKRSRQVFHSNSELSNDEILLTSDYELSKLRGKSIKDAEQVKNAISSNILGDLKTAFDVEIERSRAVSTGCAIIDRLLGGGLERKCITEIYGEFGCGKTQIALQIAANAWETGVVYICTEDFPSRRLNQMLQQVSAKNGDRNEFSAYGDKIFILQVKEVSDLIKCVRVRLKQFLSLHSSISAIILDSITSPFRGNYGEENSSITRSRHLRDIGVNLIKYAKEYDLAVLCINQVSSDFNSIDNGIVPCLGLVWSNLITTRISLSKTREYVDNDNTANIFTDVLISDESLLSNATNVRSMNVVFSHDVNTDKSCKYIITQNGVTGLG